MELRERAKWDIREGIVGAEAFIPKHVIVTTWKNVSFNGGNSNSRARRVVSREWDSGWYRLGVDPGGM